MDPKEALKKALDRIAALRKAGEGGHTFSADEVAEIKKLTDDLPGLKAAAHDVSDVLDQLRGVGSAKGGRQYLALKSDAMVSALAEGIVYASGGQLGGKKALLSGGTVAPVQVQTSPVSEGRPAASLFELIPVLPNSATKFEFLRQSGRDNGAAPVAEGGTKPQSTIGLAREEGQLEVVATVTEPLPYYLLKDFADVEAFVRDELLFFLIQELEAQTLNGDGTSPNLDGILGTSGVLQQAFATDAITTVRKTITTLESAGLAPAGILLSPTDWEAIELSRTSGSGELEMLNSPVDRAARRLHGLPVAVAAGLTAGQSITFSTDSVALRMDAGVEIRFAEPGNTFMTNEVVARAETRAQVQVSRPSGIVVADLTEA